MHEFCRLYLKEVMQDVRQHTTAKERKQVWTHKTGLGSTPRYEFHGPNGYYWYGQADCALHARAEGWQAWMSKNFVDRHGE